ncbi:hypothetical protein PO124_29115 [Bacillus licheniformis]|nr:hypothetical protein [Bacillus licheniformis]
MDDLPNTTAEFKQKFAYVPDELLCRTPFQPQNIWICIFYVSLYIK